MNVLITGASGFIGLHVASNLLSKGCKVTALHHKNSKNIKYCDSTSVDLIEADISCPECSIPDNINFIIHLAATGVSPKTATWDELANINIRGTLTMCMAAKKLDVPIIISGSYAEYGNSALNYHEIPVDAPLAPTYPYAASKATACQLALGFARSEGIRLGYLRIFNAFGEGQYHKNLWPALKASAIAGNDFAITPGEQIRDFIHVKEISARIAGLVESNVFKPHTPFVANIASGEPQSIRSFCEYWWDIFNAKGKLKIGQIPYRQNEVMRYVPCMKASYL